MDDEHVSGSRFDHAREDGLQAMLVDVVNQTMDGMDLVDVMERNNHHSRRGRPKFTRS